MHKTSAKANARYIANILKAHNCNYVVIAPGSRNAPLIIAFTADEDFVCISVPDERSAAFTALGMTIGLKEPVAVICSSGSAAVNLYPAITEAYYQKLPLVAITADRPLEMIDQGVGQTIRQENVFQNHIVKSVDLLREPHDRLSSNYNQRLINEAMIASADGPVQINVPFEEPLYDTVSPEEESIRIFKKVIPEKFVDDHYLQELAGVWNASDKIMLLTGQMDVSEWLSDSIVDLTKKSAFLTLTETVSNLHTESTIRCIDRLISPLNEEQKRHLQPDLLITIGGEIVSKRIRNLLTEYPPEHHWHISESGEIKDTFMALNTIIPVQADNFLEQLAEVVQSKDTAYRDHWMEEDTGRRMIHDQYLKEISFSDFKVYEHLFKNLPKRSLVHMANSTSVRYAQLFDHNGEVFHFANRGTSGIDGCTSTAIGHALTTSKIVTLITGDVAFLYDSNAFWNDSLPGNIRIVIINNGGGNIFRIIEGPEKGETMERYQETIHNYRGEGIAKTYGIDYKLAKSEAALVDLLPAFFINDDKPKILEVLTPREESPEILKNYFKKLSNG